MNRIRSIKILFLLQAFVLIALVVASSLRIIQFHYPRAVENEPLLSPVNVQSVDGNTLVLEDGRTFSLSMYGQLLDKVVEQSGFRVDVETSTDSSLVFIYAKSRGWICGTPWTGLIEIPLIPDDVPINQRVCIGLATEEDDTVGDVTD